MTTTTIWQEDGMGSLDFDNRLRNDAMADASNAVAAALDGNGDLIKSATALLELVQMYLLSPEGGAFDPDAYPLDTPGDAPDYWASYDAYWKDRCTTENPCPVRAMQGGQSCGH